MRFTRIDRWEFLTRYFDYSPDEHVLFLGPTGSGKTKIALDALSIVSKPKTPSIIFAMKPRDSTLDNFAEVNHFREVRSWPPPMSVWKPRKPPGYLLKPQRIKKDIYGTRKLQYTAFKEAILDSYERGNRILFADETYSLTHELPLTDELVTVWTKGRSMRCALWAASQRPAYIPTWAYSQSTHLFVSFDPDARSRKRYEEISGVDPKTIAEGTEALDEFEWLYVHVAGRKSRICIVSA
jgi:energy-coupling factor transporter ATP-binding protein EcfA2